MPAPRTEETAPCPACGGFGGEQGRSRLNPEFTPCSTCGGTGRATEVNAP